MSQQKTPTPPSPLEYPKIDGIIDDVYDAQGNVKPEWRYLLQSISELGHKNLYERHNKARRILRDDGVTYNIYDDATIPNRTWGLDLIPSVISSTDWATIEAGLSERAELFNLLLKDIYGERRLIKHGIIPPEALFAHSGFLRSCDGIHLPGEHQLILHAVDMVRTDDGSMCVISDRTQAPSGAGYALENRTVMSRIFPSLFRDSHVHRLAPFFQKLRLKLMSLSTSEDMPRVVVLTPGSHNETYFEHAYLANYLGFPLVQSGDLVARNGYIWMKSLDGLTRVDVILRRVDDMFCDPVELRSDSHLGVAGLLEVARQGRVVIANPLGSGVLENPVLLKYMPEIGKFLLGREPRLKSAHTYWGGDAEDLKYIETHFSSLLIKSIYRGSGIRSVWAADLTIEEQGTLLAQIKEKPYFYVAQEHLKKSHVPSFAKDGLKPLPTILRTFAVAADASYSVMPGGLTRIGGETSARFVSMQLGSKSKDTWITASEPERTLDNNASPDSAVISNDSNLISLPSRVVENLFWMGRYAERAEASLRILRTAFMMINGEEPITAQCKRILLSAVTQITSTQPGFIDAPESLIAMPDEELLLVITDERRIGSIRSTLNAMLHSADQSKELLSSDMMRVINDIRDALGGLNKSISNSLASAPEEALDPLVTALMALSGLTQESMVRTIGWRFMEIGKRIERAIQTIYTVQTLMSKVVTPSEQQTMLSSLLRSLEVLITYRRRYRSRVDLQLGLELVLLDPTNPRSLLFQFEELQNHINQLPKAERRSCELVPEERATLEAITTIKLTRLAQTLETETDERENLTKLLQQLEELVCSVSNVISDKYFDHRVDPQQLVSTFWGESD